ncbi:TadE/TadG family type IV pilus assembly protein [Microvirga sp. GCM10011540]|uniref:TadE/TadG family type IV pilus assembly protein n=1 Tax=Microvirga sp. GCM10011540 TaxID=3317338 RepID=UPI00360D3882
MRGRIKGFPGDVRGATAVEFAFVLPILLAFVLGTINLSLFILTTASLHYAAEKGARCGALNGACPESELKSYYYAPGPGPTFTQDPGAACGYAITATVPFRLNAVIYHKSITLSASSCFP